MILPDKHLRLEESIFGLGAVVLKLLRSEKDFDELWDEYSSLLRGKGLGAGTDVELFVLVVDWLYMIGAIELNSDHRIFACE